MKLTIILFAAILLSACGRKTSNDEISEQPEIETSIDLSDTTLITSEDPFKNQPNRLCTIIRKLDISLYSPSTVTDDPSAYPAKYCLLDICLETTDPGAMTINLGEDGETVSTTFKLIKVFTDYQEAKSYADKHMIEDVKWEE